MPHGDDENGNVLKPMHSGDWFKTICTVVLL